MFHAYKSLKSHQLHEESTNIKVILNIIFIIMLMVQGIPIGVFNHLLNNKKGEIIIIRNNGYLIKKPIE